MSSVILSIEGLTKTFGGVTAVDNIDMELNEGEIFGIIGPNGAGKTTLINILTGVVKGVSKGKIIFNKQNILEFKADQIAKMGIRRTFQNISLFNKLTVFENVMAGALSLMTRPRTERFLNIGRAYDERKNLENNSNEIIEFLGLTEYTQNIAADLPYGMQKRLEIARALVSKPVIILLDEPCAGMNPQEYIEMIRLIKRIKEKGSTIIIVEHNMNVIMNVCERIMVMYYGKKLTEGSPNSIRNDKAVIEAYLGSRGGVIDAIS